MVRETRIQSQVESYQRFKKWYLMPPCLTLSIIRWGSRVKWINPGKGVAPSPTSRCSSYWKGSLRITLDYGRQLCFAYSFKYLVLIQIIYTYMVSSIPIKYKKIFKKIDLIHRWHPTKTAGQSGPESDSNEEVILNPQISRTGASSQDAVLCHTQKISLGERGLTPL